MQIIERAEAKKQGLKTFYTGRPCRNGHDTYRYTQSGSCSGCVNGDKAAIVDATLPARKAAKAEMVKARFRIYDVDRDTFAASVWLSTIMRFPEITQSDIDPKLLPIERDGFTSMYSFYCHADDVAALRDIANSLKSTHRIDFELAKRNLHQQIQRQLPTDTTPPVNYN